MSNTTLSLAAGATALLLAACGGGGGDADSISGSVVIDGSSTVFPVSEAFAEEFQAANRDARITVGLSGTGGGFQRFCSGETDFTGASRPISEGEREACAAAGIDWIELAVAVDGLSVIVNPANDFLTCLTVEELERIWRPDSPVTTWRDVRADWPAEEISLYGPGTDSGTFDYFTETIVGETGASRPDYQASEDDNILVQGVSGDRYSLGYFGYAYYLENREALKLIAVDGGAGCVLPSDETIDDGSYAPLSRPLFIYVAESSLERPEALAFAEFILENADALVPSTGYHALPADRYQEQLQAVREAAGLAG